MELKKYNFHCNNCGLNYIQWLADTEEVVCPVNSAHTLDTANIEIVTKIGTAAVFSEHNKMEVIAESRPPGTITCFTSEGDAPNTIWGGTQLLWDSSSNDDTHPNPPAGMKGKIFDVKFNTNIWLKEGAIYHMGAVHGSWCRMSVYCSAGEYYIDNAGTPQLASEDTAVSVYIPKHYFRGDVPMGDELNTEGCTREPLPPGYFLRIEIFVPESDITSTGHVTIEIYRERTCLLPGETL